MTQATVLIHNGVYGKRQITNQEFPLTKPYDEGRGYVTVWGTADDDIGLVDARNARIKVESADDFEYIGDVNTVAAGSTGTVAPAVETAMAKFLAQESDEDALARIGKSFEHLEKFASAAVEGTIRGLIAVGPPGIGKSYGVEQVMKQAGVLSKLAGGKPKYEIIKGAISAPMLYRKLYEFSAADQVIVLDDCDIEDEESLNLLKGALDSCDKREISWFKDAHWLEKEGFPEKFEFKGSVIFLTNIDFANARGKKAIHLNAIVSRCHYMDLEISSQRDRLLRIKQIVAAGMLTEYNFAQRQEKQIVDYIWNNADHMRELSLRMVKKIADLVKAFPGEWEDFAMTTCMMPSARYAAMLDEIIK